RLVLYLRMDTSPPALPLLSLHDALPISRAGARTGRGRRGRAAQEAFTVLLRGERDDAVCSEPVEAGAEHRVEGEERDGAGSPGRDRKSTRLNSSHVKISYAVFCLKKKKK